MPAVTSVSATRNHDVDGVLSGIKWATNSLTFSFPANAAFYGSGYGSGETSSFSALLASQQSVVRNILAQFSAVANLTFTEIAETSTQHGDLRYARSDAPQTAWAYYPSTAAEGGDSWYNTWGYNAPVKGGYAYLTFLHETGHALGLKHGHEADGAFPAMTFSHDSMEYSVMTYRAYVGDNGTGFPNEAWGFAQSLMMYDIAALQQMYGANYATNAGNTVYSWSPTTGEQFINGVGQGAPGTNRIFVTVWDGGGTDTYDLSNYTTSLRVNLQPGAWSTLSQAQLADLGYFDGARQHLAAGNIANALLYNNDPRPLIENAIGGSGNDILVGNIANNLLAGGIGSDKLFGQSGSDTLTGGSGSDWFVFDLTAVTDAQLSTPVYDTILDYDQGSGAYNFAESDRIDLSALLASAYNTGQPIDSLISAVDLRGATTLQIDVDGTLGGTNWLTIAQLSGLHYGDNFTVVLHPDFPLGNTLMVQTGRGQLDELSKDFNADTYSDILWRNDSGLVATWELKGSQVFATHVFETVASSWHLEAAGDFNADGYSDLSWRHNDGRIATWELKSGQIVGTHVFDAVPTTWHIEHVGDFNGDGFSDFLWRHDGGLVSIWGLRGGDLIGTHVLGSVATAWHIEETGDFNGDGSTDILWRHDDGRVATWEMKGGEIAATHVFGNVPNTWHVEGTSDFNGDGYDDILWRHDNGDVVTWNLRSGIIIATRNLGSMTLTWHVEETGDFNGDGFGDVLWRNDNGNVSAWHVADSRTVSTADYGGAPNVWHIVTQDYDLF
jgi:Ca2+-binding RTX toxin-like protein